MTRWKDEYLKQMSEADLDSEVRIAAALKVILLPDYGASGGLNEHTRKLAWQMADELSHIIARRYNGPTE